MPKYLGLEAGRIEIELWIIRTLQTVSNKWNSIFATRQCCLHLFQTKVMPGKHSSLESCFQCCPAKLSIFPCSNSKSSHQAHRHVQTYDTYWTTSIKGEKGVFFHTVIIQFHFGLVSPIPFHPLTILSYCLIRFTYDQIGNKKPLIIRLKCNTGQDLQHTKSHNYDLMDKQKRFYLCKSNMAFCKNNYQSSSP